MAKIQNVRFEMDASKMIKACEKATCALKAFQKAVSELQDADFELKTIDEQKTKWWQISKWKVWAGLKFRTRH